MHAQGSQWSCVYRACFSMLRASCASPCLLFAPTHARACLMALLGPAVAPYCTGFTRLHHHSLRHMRVCGVGHEKHTCQIARYVAVSRDTNVASLRRSLKRHSVRNASGKLSMNPESPSCLCVWCWLLVWAVNCITATRARRGTWVLRVQAFTQRIVSVL